MNKKVKLYINTFCNKKITLLVRNYLKDRSVFLNFKA